MPGMRDVKTTETSLAIIEALWELDGATGEELSDYLDLGKTAIYQHLNTLSKRRYVTKEGTQYQVGLKWFVIGEYARYRKREYELANTKASELAQQVDEEVNFSVEEHGRMIVLFDQFRDARAEGFQAGKQFYLHNTAAGKAILAALPDGRVEAILDRWGLPKQTENTITDRTRLMEELELIRERGWARNDQECIEGLYAVGTAITYPDGSVLGALDISGPKYRLPADEELASLLLQTAEELEADVSSLFS